MTVRFRRDHPACDLWWITTSAGTVGRIQGWKTGLLLVLPGHDLGQSSKRPEMAWFPHVDDARVAAEQALGVYNSAS